MRFLADESCDAALGQALLEAGNDVLEVREAKPGADDEWVVSLAVSENRILLTEDKDFGGLIYAHGHKAIGVIFLRYPVSERNRIAQDLVELVKQQNEKLIGSFVTVTPKRIRIGPNAWCLIGNQCNQLNPLNAPLFSKFLKYVTFHPRPLKPNEMINKGTSPRLVDNRPIEHFVWRSQPQTISTPQEPFRGRMKN